MKLFINTIASAIRERIGLMAALATAAKPDGGKYSYREILQHAGLPDDHRHVRELSNQLLDMGIRRHAERITIAPDQPEQDAPLTFEEQPSAYLDAELRNEICTRLDAIAQSVIIIGNEIGWKWPEVSNF